MKKKNLTVTVSRTVQIKQYEPLVLSLTEHYELDPEDNLKELRRKITNSIASSILSSMEDLKKKLE